MKRRFFKIAVVLVLLLPSLAELAFAEELAIKGIKLGMTREELISLNPGLDCTPVCRYRRTQNVDVPTLQTLGAEPVESWWFEFSSDNKLMSADAKLNSRSGPSILTAFTEKFGKPSTSEASEFKTAAGYKGPKQTNTWVRGDTLIAVIFPHGKITDMTVTIYSKSVREEQIKSRQERAKKDL